MGCPVLHYNHRPSAIGPRPTLSGVNSTKPFVTASRGVVRTIQLIGVVSWNVATRRGPLEELREMDADVALLAGG